MHVTIPQINMPQNYQMFKNKLYISALSEQLTVLPLQFSHNTVQYTVIHTKNI